MDGPVTAPEGVVTSGRPRGTRLRGAGVAIGLLVSAAMVWQSSQAAFTAETRNNGNSWKAGSVALVNNKGAAMFSAGTLLKPNNPVSDCIQVTYNGDLAGEVRLYTANINDYSKELDTLLTMKIEIGTVASTCASFTAASTLADTNLRAIATARTNWTNGLVADAWKPTGSGSETRAYKFTHTVANDNTAMGDQVDIDFVWEVQSS
ncbi:MAG TPA: hypothetical protein VES42_27775 [Pilimelia sp.]|nr:hypothetical protein [Pilimelia sp.]